jgi:hypothetical protein
VFPARYELNSYIVFKKHLVSKRLILFTVGRTLWTEDQPVSRPIPTHRTTGAQNKRTQTSMPPVGFELTTPLFGLAKTIHAFD